MPDLWESHDVKLILVGDVHLSDRPPSIRTDDYTDEVFAKLAEVNDLAARYEVDAIIQAGDVFHFKAPSRTSHRLVQRFITDVLGTAPAPWYCVPGNHDMQHDRLASLDSQPLGVLFEAGLRPLIGRVEITTDPFGGTTAVYGIPYLQDWAELPEVWGTAWQQADARLLVTHASIFPNDDRPPYEHFTADDWLADLGMPDDMAEAHVFYGHIHDHHGVYRDTSGQMVFCNHGALTRGSLSEADLKREVSVTLYDEAGVDGTDEVFRRIPLTSAKPVAEVFRMAEKAATDLSTARINSFLSKVEATTIDRISIESVLAEVEANADISTGARTQIRDALEEALSP